MQQPELLPHLFRHEYRKIVAVLCKTVGIQHIETAEDLVSDVFLQATETWKQNGLPENPTAWLYAVAKNKARDFLRRENIFLQKIKPEVKQSSPLAEEIEIDLSAQNISDSQLQMMFAVCHPAISSESQIGLALNVLCGFGVDEIADAFLSNRETIYKRLARAKEKLKSEKVRIEVPLPAEIELRLANVLTTLYLLFSEGYYSTSQNKTLRNELCVEAMRLCFMLTQYEQTNSPQANALLALMCYHASRFDARIDAAGDAILYEDQDESLWNQELIQQGNYFMNRSASGQQLTKYHIEAGIAFWHTHKADTPEKWESILLLYNQLLQIEYSPVAALNRTYALAKANGNKAAIREAEKLKLNDNHLYFALLATLYEEENPTKAQKHWKQAYALAKTETEKRNIAKRIV